MSLLFSDAPKFFYEVWLQSPDPIVPGVFCEQDVSLDTEDDAVDFAVHAVGHPFSGARIYLCRMICVDDFMGTNVERRLIRVYALHNNGVYLKGLYPSVSSSVFDSSCDSIKSVN